MNNVLIVGRLECLGNLPGNRQRFIQWNRSLRDSVSQRRAFDEFEHQRLRAAALLEPVYPADARMV